MKTNILLHFALFFYTISIAQTLPPKQAYPINVKQLHSGHSLTDPLFNNWPGQYPELINKLGGSYDNVQKSVIPGAPLRWRWSNPSGAPDARLNIADWELLSITEGSPLLYEGGSRDGWYISGIQEQKEYLSLFVNHAWANGNKGNGTPTLLWTTWVAIDGSHGNFRQMLDIQGAEWERMQDFANLNRPTGAPPVYMIPGHKMMARIYDDIQQGKVPGITNINQFFSDNIHLNSLGDYAVTMMHYACIFNKNPVGLTNDLIWSTNTSARPTSALASYLQTIVWEIVTTYSRTGIYSVVTSITESNKMAELEIYPNPATDVLYLSPLNESQEQEYTICDNLGRVVLEGKGNYIDIQNMPSNLYYLKAGNSYFHFIKK